METSILDSIKHAELPDGKVFQIEDVRRQHVKQLLKLGHGTNVAELITAWVAETDTGASRRLLIHTNDNGPYAGYSWTVFDGPTKIATVGSMSLDLVRKLQKFSSPRRSWSASAPV